MVTPNPIGIPKKVKELTCIDIWTSFTNKRLIRKRHKIMKTSFEVAFEARFG